MDRSLATELRLPAGVEEVTVGVMEVGFFDDLGFLIGLSRFLPSTLLLLNKGGNGIWVHERTTVMVG